MGLHNLYTDRLWNIWLKINTGIIPNFLMEPQMSDINRPKGLKKKGERPNEEEEDWRRPKVGSIALIGVGVAAGAPLIRSITRDENRAATLNKPNLDLLHTDAATLEEEDDGWSRDETDKARLVTRDEEVEPRSAKKEKEKEKRKNREKINFLK